MTLAQMPDQIVARHAPLLRPLRPVAGVHAAQRLEGGKQCKLAAALAAKRLEIGPRPGIAEREEIAAGHMQRRALEPRHRQIVDELAAAQPLDLGTEALDLPRLEARRQGHVDIERIDEQPAARRVRAPGRRAVVEQRVQRIEAHARAAKAGDDLKERCEVGEIAMPPVARRAHAVELHRENPDAAAVALEGRLRRDPGIGINRRLGLRFRQRCDHAPQHLRARLVTGALDIEIGGFDAPPPRGVRQIFHEVMPRAKKAGSVKVRKGKTRSASGCSMGCARAHCREPIRFPGRSTSSIFMN